MGRRSTTLIAALCVAATASVPLAASYPAAASTTGPRSTARAAHHPDFDGDGYADLVLPSTDTVGSATAAGAAWVLYGGPHGANTGDRHAYFTESLIGRGAHSDQGDNFAYRSATGDLNGDGYDDLALSAPNKKVGTIAGAGAVVVLYGGPDGLETSDAQYFTEATSGMGATPATNDTFGSALAIADFNHDGVADLAIGALGKSVAGHPLSGAVYELFGTRARLSHAAPLLPRRFDQSTAGIHGGVRDNDQFGYGLSSGDYDGDGFADLAVEVPGKDVGAAANAGVVDVLRGSGTGLTGAGAQTWSENTTGIPDTAEAGDLWGFTLASLDVNGDGRSDLVVGAPTEGQGATGTVGAATLLYGSTHGLSAAGAEFFLIDNTTQGQVSTALNYFASSLTPLDFDGDGRVDLAIGVEGHVAGAKNYAGEVVVLHNVGTRLSRAGGFVFDRDTAGMVGPSAIGQYFGARLIAGDFSGNGRDDLAVSLPGLQVSGRDFAGATQVFYGAPTGFATNDQQFTANTLGGTPVPGARLGGVEFELG